MIEFLVTQRMVFVRTIMLLIFITLIAESSYAQGKYRGQIFDENTSRPLRDVSVNDLTSHSNTISGTDGKFTINAKVGDILIFNLLVYQADTILITNLSEVKITLTSNKTLGEVKIKSSKISLGDLSTPKPGGVFNSKEALYQTDGVGHYIGGVKFMFDESKIYNENKVKQQKLNLNEQRQQDISTVFCADTLRKYLPIKGQELDNFIILYRPDAKIYYSSGFNLVRYLSASYREFNKIAIEKRQSKELTKIGQ
jgi:hypothetical protein